MRHEFHPQALNEYREAAHWYNEREPLLALRFVDDACEARQIESTLKTETDPSHAGACRDRKCQLLSLRKSHCGEHHV